jgi:sulfate transport system substrate-binding protein
VLGLTLAVAPALPAAEPAKTDKTVELLNASDGHAQELWKELNERFAARHNGDAPALQIRQTAGGWSSVLDGILTKKIEPDVVTLGLGTDVDALRRAGLLNADWEYRLPHRSTPYTSPIVILVPKGNPQKIRDWSDLARPEVQVVTGDPKRSRTAQFSYLAAYGAVLQRGGSEAEARELLTRIARQARILTPAAPAKPGETARTPESAANPILPQNEHEVLLNWEKEAIDIVEAAKGKVEIVYPPITIRTGPEVAVVDTVVDKHGTRAAAEAYLRFLFSDEGQEIIARHHLRPIRAAGLKPATTPLPRVEQFGLSDLTADGRALRERWFGERGLFEQARADKK